MKKLLILLLLLIPMQVDALPEVDISFVIFPDDKGVYLEARKEEHE